MASCFADEGADELPRTTSHPFDDAGDDYDPTAEAAATAGDDGYGSFPDGAVDEEDVEEEIAVEGDGVPIRHASGGFSPSLFAPEFEPDGGPVLPPLAEMGREEGILLREWRRSRSSPPRLSQTARPISSFLGCRGAEPYHVPSPPPPPFQPHRSNETSAPHPVATMGEPSKELLDLPSEHRPPSSFIESLLASRGQQQEKHAEGKRKPGPPADPLPKSQVLGRVQGFLEDIAKANEKLQLDVQNKPREEYDIEALTGNETGYIEMDLLLGVADLHSEQAVDAAEAAMNGCPPSGKAFACSSSESEDDSIDSEEDGGDEPVLSCKDKCEGPDEAGMGPPEGKEPNKRQKIVVLN